MEDGGMCNRLTAAVALAAALLSSVPAAADWSTYNSPDPFCNDAGSPEYGCTWFTIYGEPTAEVVLEVWDPDTTGVLIRSDLGAVGPGAYVLMWCGTDGMDTVLPEGGYPYRIVFTGIQGGTPVFGEWEVAHITCDSPVERTSWGALKGVFR